jgi:hypothetical protein
MKTFVQTLGLVAGLAGLSACASSDAAMSNSSSYEAALADCQERVARLEEMNRSCYRK